MAFGDEFSGERPMSEINVTPLVDVMLVLLIIFMVTAPMMVQGVQVELPDTNAPTIRDEKEILVLTVTKEKKLFLGDAEIKLQKLKELLKNNAKAQKDKEVFLHADQSLAYGYIVEVMALVRAGGVENIGMVTDPVEKRSVKKK